MAPRPDLNEMGTTGLKRTSGFVHEEFLPQLQGSRGAKVFREMADNDAIVGSYLYAIEKVITRIDFHFEPFADDSDDGGPKDADIETATFFDTCLNDMNDSWDSTLAQILSMIPFGWSFHEIVYKRRVGPDEKKGARRSKYDDGKIGWRKWAPRAQETLWAWMFDDDGDVIGMEQIDPYSASRGRVEIPLEKALLFRTSTAKGNPEGRSLLRNAYLSWWFKRRIQEIEAVGVERDLAGMPVAWVPAEYLSSDATAAMRGVLAVIQDIVTGIKRNEHEGVIMPMIYDESGNKMFDLQLMSSGGTRQFDTDKILARYNQNIAMTVLSDFILLGHERVGSFALGSTKMDLFTMSIDSLCKTIADTINAHAVPRLMRLNGMDTKRPPRLVYSEVANVELGEVADFISKMATAGIIAPDPGLEDYLRELAGLPPANHGIEADGDLGAMSEEDQKAILALPPAQRIVAERTGIVPDPPPFPGAVAPTPKKGKPGEKPKPGEAIATQSPVPKAKE
jgi:hypothetical protein